MDAILAVFRSRAQAYSCVERLKRYGVNASAVSTPTEANVGCGISARFPASEFPRARGIVAAGGWSAFVGYFRVVVRGGSTFVGRA